MYRIIKTVTTCLIGGTLYYTIEILMRGYSHYSMFICGGICFLFVGMIGKTILEKATRADVAIITIMTLGSMTITTMEFITGLIVNVIFGMNVWDYSNMDYNVMGQICPVFSILWAMISLPCVYIDSMLRKCIFGEKIEYIEG